jgi:class 3 adenylate cyclase
MRNGSLLIYGLAAMASNHVNPSQEAQKQTQELSNLGSLLDEQPPSRQQIAVTVLFADICGSTQLFEQYGDWRARQIESRVLTLLSSETLKFGGAVIKTIGDEIMSRFPTAEHGVKAACQMQEAVSTDPALSQLNIAIKIGLHHGLVLVEQNDVFGDAVNVAARMVSQAKADQIIISRETIRFLSEKLERMTRSLGWSRVRGKQEEMEIFEVIWQEETTGLTQLFRGNKQEELRHLLSGKIILEYRQQKLELEPSAQLFSMGRGHRNHLIVDQEMVSRSHADIQFRQGKFILIDHSTNGTYVLLENGANFFLRREEFTLLEQGCICLGQAITADTTDLIRFQCVRP